MEAEVHYLLHKNHSSQMDSVRVFTPILTTIPSNIILAFISAWHCKNLRTKAVKEWIRRCTDLMVLLNEGDHIDLILQQEQRILKHNLHTEILQGDIIEIVTLKNQY